MAGSEVTGWGSFLKELESATKDIDEPFFRGHADLKWPLIPSLGRQKVPRNFENNVYYDFLTYGTSLLPPSPDSWDTLFIMRHHGLPTRLLDWTQSFAVALSFALAGCKDNGVIWILDPYRLNKRTVKDEALWHPQTDFKHGYFEYFIGDQLKRFPGEAIAILPNKTTARVLAQRAVFTIHRNAKKPLDLISGVALRKVILPRNALEGAREFLRLAGIHEFTLFPDLDGLARWLKTDYQLDDVVLPRKISRRVRRRS